MSTIQKKQGERPRPVRLTPSLMRATLLSAFLAPQALGETARQPKERHRSPVQPGIKTQAAPARTIQSVAKNSSPESLVVQSNPHRVVHPNGTLLTKSDWTTALTGSNPLSLLATTPGVSYVSSDSFGLDESDASLFMRGFHMNELGILFEGIPLNDVSFTTLTGNNVLNIGVPDQIGSIYVSPGTSRESTFSSANKGGELRYRLQNPTDAANGAVSQSVGSNATYVTTVTGNTGQIGRNGPKILAGFQRISKNKYEGGGSQFMVRGDVKATQDVAWGFHRIFRGVTCAGLGI